MPGQVWMANPDRIFCGWGGGRGVRGGAVSVFCAEYIVMEVSSEGCPGVSFKILGACDEGLVYGMITSGEAMKKEEHLELLGEWLACPVHLLC